MPETLDHSSRGMLNDYSVRALCVDLFNSLFTMWSGSLQLGLI